MSNHKNYNSIAFLTTLSICLGLVLIGAPPMLSRAALTRDFDVTNEIEVKDDLDNKPDKEEFENLAKEDFPSLFAQLLNEIKAEVETRKISLPIQANFSLNITSIRFGNEDNNSGGGGGGSGIGSSSNSNPLLDALIQNAIDKNFEPKAFELADFDSEKSKRVKIEIQANAADWMLKISFGKMNAEKFAEFLNREFLSSAASAKDTLTKQIYQNTTLSSENNQVFIVTRLPRASIDEFLARSDAK